jgi:hypothetical protein
MSGPERFLRDEIGRELRFSDLKARTIVVIKPPDPQNRGVAFTFWVSAVRPDVAVFTSGVLFCSLVMWRGPDDTIIDGDDRRIWVFEYLGQE